MKVVVQENGVTRCSQGSAVVRIYNAGGKSWVSHIVRYYFNGRAVQQRFKEMDKALQYAEQTLNQLNAGTLMASSMDPADKAAYGRAQQIASQYGKSVELFVSEHAQILKLAGKVPLHEMVKFYQQHHPEHFVVKSICEVAEEMYSAKKSDGRSKTWIAHLRVRIGKLQQKFGPETSIRDLNGVAINDWIRSLKRSSRTKNNYRSAIQTLVTFAKSKKYLIPEFSEMTYVPSVACDDEWEIEIYTPDELLKLLNASRWGLFRHIAFCAFSGLRSAEFCRLRWENVRDDGIEVGKKIAKTASRRIAPMLPPLSKLIAGHPKAGRIWNQNKESLQARTLLYLKHRSGVEWKRNALRHSFISYRLAIVKDAAKVALECGTSPAKIFSNYRQLVTEKEAKRWFQIYNSVTVPASKRFNDRLQPVKTVSKLE